MVHIWKRKTKLDKNQQDQLYRLYYKENLPVPFLIDLYSVCKTTIYKYLNVSAIRWSKRKKKPYNLRKNYEKKKLL